MFRVTREDGECEKRQRYDAETDGRRETMKRKKEARDARRDRRYEKPLGPSVEPLAGEQAKQDDQAGKNSYQANQHVNYCVDVQYHRLPIT